MSFLTENEILEIQNDAEILLLSPEASDIKIIYKSGNTGNYNSAYKQYDGKDIETTIDTRAIIKLVKVQDIDLISTGEIKSGDAIFYVSKTLDLVDKKNIRIYFNNVYWKAVNLIHKQPELYDVAIMNSSVFQVILGRREKAQ